MANDRNDKTSPSKKGSESRTNADSQRESGQGRRTLGGQDQGMGSRRVTGPDQQGQPGSSKSGSQGGRSSSSRDRGSDHS